MSERTSEAPSPPEREIARLHARALAEASLQTAQASLQAQEGPAWLLNIDEGTVLDSTSEGAALLEWHDPIKGANQDQGASAAKFACASLRVIADVLGPGTYGPAKLTFQAANGTPQSLDAAVTILSKTEGKDTLAVVVAGDPQSDRTRANSEQSPHDHAPGPPTSYPWTKNMIAKLAHELKTPLNAISTASEIMKDAQLGPHHVERYQGYSADINRAAAHALQLIDRLLGRAAEDSEVAEFAALNLNKLVNEVASELAPLAQQKGVELRCPPCPGSPHVVADALSVRQMIINLMTNALKFTPSGGTVTVALSFEVDGPVEVSVTDTGPGMTEDELETFMTGANTPRRRPGGGYGMGLSITKALAESNGASLTLNSQPGNGLHAVVSFEKSRTIPV